MNKKGHLIILNTFTRHKISYRRKQIYVIHNTLRHQGQKKVVKVTLSLQVTLLSPSVTSLDMAED